MIINIRKCKNLEEVQKIVNNLLDKINDYRTELKELREDFDYRRSKRISGFKRRI